MGTPPVGPSGTRALDAVFAGTADGSLPPFDSLLADPPDGLR
jgi:hypothetical protein